MKVTKDMIDKGLQSYYGGLRILSYLLQKKWRIKLINFLISFTKGKNIKGLNCEERFIQSQNGGPDIRIRIFKPQHFKGELPALLYYHGGGYVIMNPESSLSIIEKFIKTRPCVVIAPDYRKAIKYPFPAGFNDCYDSLLWAKENSVELGILHNNFIIAGHSAGGGLTAAVVWKARDTQDAQIAFQMPIYPMIDDRQDSISAKDNNIYGWNSKTNDFAWKLYLKNIDANNFPKYAAPSRNLDYENFPPTITFVGDLEPFKDETVEYVEALKRANVPAEFKIYKGCFHGFDIIGVKSKIAQDAVEFTYGSFANYYDTYLADKI